jgi:hypothetical protein
MAYLWATRLDKPCSNLGDRIHRSRASDVVPNG